jgi:hypothetical protein
MLRFAYFGNVTYPDPTINPASSAAELKWYFRLYFRTNHCVQHIS